MGIFHKHTFEKILKELGAERISDKAAKRFMEVIEEKIMKVAKISVELAKHAGRRTVLKEDVKLAKRKVFE